MPGEYIFQKKNTNDPIDSLKHPNYLLFQLNKGSVFMLGEYIGGNNTNNPIDFLKNPKISPFFSAYQRFNFQGKNLKIH